MRNVILALVIPVMIISLLLSSFVTAGPTSVNDKTPTLAAGPITESSMPPNEFLIMRSLRAQGLIPTDAIAEEAFAIYSRYVGQKLGQNEDQPNPLAAAHLRRGEASGQPPNTHGQVLRPNNRRFDNILTLLVEFAGTDTSDNVTYTGPLHNELPPPDPQDNSSFWIPDFNPEHYQDMLFDMTPGAKSMSNYFLEQSGYTYTVDGQVYGWVAVNHSEWWYGADGPTGIDNLNGPAWRVVQDAVAAATDVPWAAFDTEDPYDLDWDGVYDEPDGYVDHIQLIHAGAAQEAGGGAQGDDAIWSHSSWADFGSHGPGYGGVPTSDPNVWVGPYTINPEDGTIGVFCHEFAHDLGLPDLYDTISSGEASTGYWTLMGDGGWLACPGEPLGTCPASMGAWEKYVLGWLEPVVVNPGEVKNNILLRSAGTPGPAAKAVQVRLPSYTYNFYVNEPYSGSYEWYSGIGDNLNNTLTQEVTLPTGAQLAFWTWYDIELDWDYGYVEVSTDGGATWSTVQGNITTSFDPNGNNQEGNGITGNSGGWVFATFNLSAYGGETALLRFRYETDAYVQGLGWTVDDISINGFFDDVESGNMGWTADGWYIFDGQSELETFHYYMAEWRTPRGFDVSMTNWYYPLFFGNTVETFSSSPGMLLWYRNGRYTDNWVGMHPWAGLLLVVDAHPNLVLADDLNWLANLLFDPDPNMGLPFRNRIQLADATFSLNPTEQQPISMWESVATNSYLPALPGVPTFDDSLSYVDASWEPWFYANPYSWYIRNSINSVDTPTYGVKIIVKGSSPNNGRIKVDFSGFTP